MHLSFYCLPSMILILSYSFATSPLLISPLCNTHAIFCSVCTTPTELMLRLIALPTERWNGNNSCSLFVVVGHQMFW
uniref:Putative secreted protein n=1 Tax=Anopheles darlingi TaxID=43151 RepID=A0A2M4DLZ2_ANODA